MENLLRLAGWLGRRGHAFVHYLLALGSFTARALITWLRHNPFNPAVRRSLVTQLIFTGVDALPAVGLLALAVGVSITYKLIDIMRLVGDRAQIVSVLAEMVALELGSLLTAIVIIGRSGSAIAVDLGGMRLRREVDGLELLGIDVFDFFVIPRIAAAALAQLVLAIYFSLIALVSGIAVSALLISPAIWNYLDLLPGAFAPSAVLMFVVKNLTYGLVIGATACFHALRVGRSPTELPQQTQRAIIVSIVLVFVLDGFVALVQPR